MKTVVLSAQHLGRPPWPTLDPFLFCVHHVDGYPAGNTEMGIDASALAGRSVGSDFSSKDGWSMYHGDVIPGFPRHPHRGFETITIARRGYIDHADSLGATARFGHGDVQWMTAGSGIVHSEMFPLVKQDGDNPAELFQIWLNLPASDKMVDPYFTMLWNHEIPVRVFKDTEGRETEVTVVAGSLWDATGPRTPPNSWAAREDSKLAIYTIRLAPGAEWTLPAAVAGLNRCLYAFVGSATVAGQTTSDQMLLRLASDQPVPLAAGPEGAELLLLQARPISEPVARHGPFVMNTTEEIHETYAEYRRTQFGGWPWPSTGPSHAREQKRFALHADGRREEP